MYIKTFKLKQHTPMIHFQSGENGATLRASEVKPKLDKFLIKKLGKDNINKEWRRRDENGEIALDYGLSFVAKDTEEIEIVKYHKNSPMYFGNMGDGKHKHLVFADDGVEGKIKCKNKKLLKNLETELPEFFFLHNFGTRQSKGYGSFTVESIGEEIVKFKYFSKYSFNLNVNDWQKAMTQLGLFYQSLRSGINIGFPNTTNKTNGNHPNAIGSSIMNTNFYMKPIIFLYAKSINEQWDKKTIKENYFNNQYHYRSASKDEKKNFNNGKRGLIETEGLPKQEERYKNSDILSFSNKKSNGELQYDFRDLFGLSSDEKWYSYGAEIKKENTDIKRFKSPITFKIIKSKNKYDVFIHLSTIYPKYKGAKFNIKSVEYKKEQDSLSLQIPENLEMNDLFDFIAQEYDITKNIESKFHNYFDKKLKLKPYEILKSIYSQLKNQTK